MLEINSHGFEISIAGCVEEMVCDPNPMPFSFIFFFFICFVLINYWEQRRRAALAMVKKEPHPLVYPPGARKKAINPSLSGTRPTGHQPRNIRNQTPTEGAEQENQINKRGGSNRKTLAVDTNNKIHNCENHYETQCNRQ